MKHRDNDEFVHAVFYSPTEKVAEQTIRYSQLKEWGDNLAHKCFYEYARNNNLYGTINEGKIRQEWERFYQDCFVEYMVLSLINK